jgi:hypothetical protein
MQFVSPDLLNEARGLSLTASGIGLGVGALVWMLGGWSHRFWLVLLITLGAGVYGLSIGDAFNVQPLVAALLFAVAAGTLALSLVRVTAFLAGGMAACILAEQLVPKWNEPFIFFFVGGFLALFLLRFWLMVLSSLIGTLLMAYSLLWLLDTMGKMDAVGFATAKPVLLNWCCGGVALLGLVFQVAIERRRRRKERGREEEEEERPRGGSRWFGGGSRKGRRAA